MLGIFYSSLPSPLSCRTFTFISGFGRKVSGCRFVGHFALGHTCFLLSFRETWFLFLGEALPFCFLGKLFLFPGQWHVPACGLWLTHGWTLEAVGFLAFSIPALHT